MIWPHSIQWCFWYQIPVLMVPKVNLISDWGRSDWLSRCKSQFRFSDFAILEAVTCVLSGLLFQPKERSVVLGSRFIYTPGWSKLWSTLRNFHAKTATTTRLYPPRNQDQTIRTSLLPSLKPKLKNPSNATGETSLPTINLHLLYLFQAEYHSVEFHTCSKSARKVQARFVATLPKPQAFRVIFSGHTALFQLVILGSARGWREDLVSRVFPMTSTGFDKSFGCRSATCCIWMSR